MARRTYTAEQRAEALALYATDGPTAVQAQLGIPKQTVVDWARADGIRMVRTETVHAGTEANLATMAQIKAQLARDLLGDVQRLRQQMFAPCVERKAVTVGTGRGESEVEIVDIDRDQPTFAEQTRIMTAVAIGIDKVQILTGEATEITEHRHLDAVDDELRRLAAELEQRVDQPA